MNFAIYIFFIIINLIYSYIITTELEYDAIQLNNGSFVVISTSGLYILDPTFQILYSDEGIYFEDGNSFSSQIKQFPKEDESFIFITIWPNDYIINSDGKLFRINIIDIDYLDKYQYSLIPF